MDSPMVWCYYCDCRTETDCVSIYLVTSPSIMGSFHMFFVRQSIDPAAATSVCKMTPNSSLTVPYSMHTSGALCVVDYHTRVCCYGYEVHM
jgi:hypothetical protein